MKDLKTQMQEEWDGTIFSELCQLVAGKEVAEQFEKEVKNESS